MNSNVNAALANGYFGHILEMDDVDKEAISHPATVVIPAALSIGEWQFSTGAELLAAIIAGYKKAKVAMNEGSTFGPGGAGFMRMNIACPRSILVEALNRIEAAINKL